MDAILQHRRKIVLELGRERIPPANARFLHGGGASEALPSSSHDLSPSAAQPLQTQKRKKEPNSFDSASTSPKMIKKRKTNSKHSQRFKKAPKNKFKTKEQEEDIEGDSFDEKDTYTVTKRQKHEKYLIGESLEVGHHLKKAQFCSCDTSVFV